MKALEVRELLLNNEVHLTWLQPYRGPELHKAKPSYTCRGLEALPDPVTAAPYAQKLF